MIRFICTFSVAHVFYLAYTSFIRQGRIEVTHHTLAFWSEIIALDPFQLSVGEIWIANETEKQYQRALDRLMRVGDAYMEIGRRYAEQEGRMSEQIDR